ncbi:Gfo/Idh/MocA family protein [Pseudarthrobacter raffinosi]|uniref:Gfo/Idh/MocA family protein n=1 Tax=Pseudarthrobacter raffinosi TaxID=2953651 RepID=UPI00208EBD14|nr:Gfo/Idh/MocA family oxidoreductase [Pseudarthrobacter sp. MDT3-9]MCO4253249.1 Gfo/Idh/MocA family oxidoreductase [Pseudarthrobacter sp. MDT3-9]
MTEEQHNMIKWGLIGASDIAATRMIPAMRSSGAAVHAVMSGSSSHAADYARANTVPAHTTDLRQLLELDIDAVYISSTNEKHYPQARMALLADKHVLCEKPMALTADEAGAMVRLADERGLVLAINHHLPQSALHRKIREVVAAGTIGKILAAQISNAGLLHPRLRGWRLSEPGTGRGVILDLTCHDASVLNPLLGIPTAVTAVAANQAEWNREGGVDTAMTLIEYENKNGDRVLAQTIDSFAMPHAKTSLYLYGTNGSLQVTDAMTQDSSGAITLTNAEGNTAFPVDSNEDPYVVILEKFAEAVRGVGRPAVSGEEGLMALRVALAAEESASSGAVVRLR